LRSSSQAHTKLTEREGEKDAIRKHYDRLDQTMLDASKALNASVADHERMRP